MNVSKKSMNMKKPALVMLLISAAFAAQIAEARQVTVGKGRGILWEGMYFNTTLVQRHVEPTLTANSAMAGISTATNGCRSDSTFINIDGIKAIPLLNSSGNPVRNIGIVPLATANATFYTNIGSVIAEETLKGTIGFPETRGQTSTGAIITNPTSNGRTWCLPARNAPISSTFFAQTRERTVNISGHWAIIGDGTQMTQSLRFPTLYAISSGGYVGDQAYQQIAFDVTQLRVSTLECSVNTNRLVNFGAVEHNDRVNSELAQRTDELSVTCTQDRSNAIATNANVQFRAISGLYSGHPNKLAFQGVGETKHGGYITGTIPKVTGNGFCGSMDGVRFDNTPVKIGDIRLYDINKTFTHPITWRLCSGGADLPDGRITAAAELLVTFD